LPAAFAAPLLACTAAPLPALPPPSPRPPAPTSPVIQAFAESEPEYAFADPDRRKKLASTFPAIEAMASAEVRAHELPGMVLGVVVDGELAYAGGFGVTDLETRVKPDADTVYRIGSITKSFTALSVLALRDDGALGLDDPLTRLLPEAGGLVYPTRDAPPLTLRQLLTHTSGLPRLGAFDYTRADREPSEDEIFKSLSGFALESAPGERLVYSNLGFGLLGIAVGRAARSSLREVVAKKILEPLGMTSTAWDPAGVPAARLATPYKKNLLGFLERASSWRLGASEGAGGIYSTLRDMTRYLTFQLAAYPPRSAPDTGGIRRSSVREAHFNALRSGALSVRMREAAERGESLVSARATSYGYAWSIEETCDFDRVVWHNGAVDGFSAGLSFLPEHGVGVVVLTNHSAQNFDVQGVAGKALLALKKGGGLAKRVAHPRLAPAFAAVMPRFLSVYNAWDLTGYKAMLSPHRLAIAPRVEQDELAGYRSLHGACKGYSPAEVVTPFHARFAMQCERGALEMDVALDTRDGLISGFAGTSRDVAAPPPLARVAERLSGLIGKWDDGVYKKHLGPHDSKPPADTAAFFESIRKSHGVCPVRSFTRAPGGQDEFSLACERGGDLRLSVKLDEKNEDAVLRYTINGRGGGGGACPVK
jgi:CubicO group peptidase (beta-lactamase class C family)